MGGAAGQRWHLNAKQKYGSWGGGRVCKAVAQMENSSDQVDILSLLLEKTHFD